MDSDRDSNRGPGPMELLLVALGACSATDVVGILKKKRQSLTGLAVELAGERAPEPPRVWTKIKIHFRVTGKGIDPRAVAHAIDLSRSKYCSVAATLAKTAQIDWTHAIEEH
jgi:putative redox protein